MITSDDSKTLGAELNTWKHAQKFNHWMALFGATLCLSVVLCGALDKKLVMGEGLLIGAFFLGAAVFFGARERAKAKIQEIEQRLT